MPLLYYSLYHTEINHTLLLTTAFMYCISLLTGARA